MIIKDITINTEEELKEFKNQCQGYVKRISSLYKLYDDTFIFKYEIQDLPIPFKGNVTISIKSDDKFIFAIVPNKTSGNNVVMAFYKLNDKEVELVRCEDTASEICMPENVMDDEGKEYKVTEIGVEAFIFFHYGLLERMFEQMDQNELKELQTMYPGIGIDNSNKKALMVEYLTLLAKEHDVVVKSGRGVPESLPSTVRFVHQISVDQALVEIKSKYLFSNLLYSSRSRSYKL